MKPRDIVRGDASGDVLEFDRRGPGFYACGGGLRFIHARTGDLRVGEHHPG